MNNPIVLSRCVNVSMDVCYCVGVVAFTFADL